MIIPNTFISDIIYLEGNNTYNPKSNIENALYNLCLKDNTILFFDLNKNTIVNTLIDNNHLSISRFFNTKGYNFIFYPKEQIEPLNHKLIQYYIPHLNNFIPTKFIESIVTFQDDYYKDILDSINYQGQIQTGFLIVIERKIYVVSINNLGDLIKILDFLKHNIIPVSKDTINTSFIDDEQVFYSPRSFTQDEFLNALASNLDSETKKIIESFEKDLELMQKSGQLLYALPILKKIIADQYGKLEFSQANSDIAISDDYKITFTKYNHLELPLSHLTKVIYILFCKHPEGIHIKELNNYRDELISLYNRISNQLDYDKIIKSIDDLIDPDNNSIYTHLSRIKSTLHQIMDAKYAEQYIITGNAHGSDFKYINAIRVL